MRIKELFFAVILLLAILIPGVKSQVKELSDNSPVFYFDAIVFKSILDTNGRLDVYILTPYQSLAFEKFEEFYASNYELTVKITNDKGERIDQKKIPKKISVKDYFVSKGGNGDFDYSQVIFNLPSGKYDIDVTLHDVLANKDYQRSRSQTVVNFSKFPYSLSGLLLVSVIEENNGKFVITPHISDNVGGLNDNFFIFFESYNNNPAIDSVDFVYEFIKSDKSIINESGRIRKFCSGKTIQQYIRIKLPANFPQSTYTLRLIALKPSNNPSYSEADYMATTERSIKYFRTIGGAVIQDLDKSIKQLRYVANQTELDYIEAAANMEEKQLRFEAFWKKLDPTPNTDRNEAFEEFYARIDFANKTYKSYSEGWRTDMGMVFIIYGQPNNIDRNRLNDGRMYERWNYTDRKIIFIDYNGFGDYRLYSPMVINDKYRYK